MQIGLLCQIGDALSQVLQQRGVVRLRRHVHRHVDHAQRRAAPHRAGLDPLTDEGAAPGLRVDQAALLRLGITPGDGGEVQAQRAGQRAQGRQALVGGELARLDVVRQRVGQRQVRRPGTAADRGGPAAGFVRHGWAR